MSGSLGTGVSTSPQSEFERDWTDLCNYLNKWYYKPDLEGLRIILCTYLSHWYLNSPPVWLSIIGLPGSGKTELGIKPLSSLSSVQSISTLTPESFLSGFGHNNGLLDKLTPFNLRDKDNPQTHAIWLFPDLTTTILSEDQFSRLKVMGIMRRIYDGEYEKKVGNQPEIMEWKGKITCIAACTPDIEDHWAVHRDMGERWLNIRWGNLTPTYSDTKKISQYAKKHEGVEKEINLEVRKKIHSLLQNSGPGPAETPDSEELDAIGILLEECRVNVKREFGTRKVSDRGNKQYNTRTSKSLGMICKASAGFRRDDKFTQEDIKLAKRIALDSIPSKRLKILQRLIELYPQPVTKHELITNLNIPKSTFDLVLDDLRYLSIIDISDIRDDNELLLDDEKLLMDNILYDFKNPGKKSKIVLNSNIIEILTDCKLLNSFGL